MDKSFYNSPVGILEIICEKDTLISLKPAQNTEIFSTNTTFIKTVKSQLDEYFLGERKIFDLKIRLVGTNFQKCVWQALQKIPYGETKSYSEIATTVGNKNAQRAVGSACNKNPVMIIIPCHRVISKNGNLGGFAYGNTLKQNLLALEKLHI